MKPITPFVRIFFCCTFWSALGAQNYTVTDLGPGRANQIISNMLVSGSGFFWSPNTGRVETGLRTVYLNASGAVAGTCDHADAGSRPCAWSEESGLLDLISGEAFEYLGGDGPFGGFVTAIGEDGTVVGWRGPTGLGGTPDPHLFQAFQWKPGGTIENLHDRLLLGNNNSSFAVDIDSSGRILINVFSGGYSVQSNSFIWDPRDDSRIDIASYRARSFNDFRQVIFEDVSGVWTFNSENNLSKNPNWRYRGINNLGQVVGNRFFDNRWQGFGPGGALLDPQIDDNGWSIESAEGIDDFGNIAATGFKVGEPYQQHVLLLTNTRPQQETWQLTLLINDNIGGDVSGSGIYLDNEVVTITAIPDLGYRFLKWVFGDSGISVNSPEIVIESSESLIITAYFEEFRWNLTSSAENGSITKSPDSEFYDHKATVILTGNPVLGYRFDHWGGDATGNENPLELLMDADKSIAGIFSKDLSDNDNDGLSAYDELVVYGTNPEKEDTDGDTIKDGDEVSITLDPTIDDTSTLQFLGTHPELYLDLVSAMEGVHPKILITKTESGDFIVKIRIESTGNLRDWEALDLTGAVIVDDTMTLMVPVSESAKFLRILGSK